MTMDSTIHLDTKRGAIRRIEQEYAQDYGFKGKGSGSMELTGVETRDAAWLASFAPAADRYFAASKAYEQATEEASKDAAKADALLADAKTALKSARDAIDHPIFREQLDRQIAQHESMASYYADSAKRRADVLDKPAADWKLQGLDGKTHALAEYRGKVVVLDFWYRGCGWCIKAMPQLNALAEQFAGRPVAVLGMNTDRNEADAKLVVDVMGLKYATLRAEGIPEKYGVQGFPTLILIDPEGKVPRRPRRLLADPPGRSDEVDRGPPAAEVTVAAVFEFAPIAFPSLGLTKDEPYQAEIDRDSCRALVPDRDKSRCHATTTPRPFSRRHLANCRGKNGPGPHCLRAHGAGTRPGVAGDAPVCGPAGAEGGRPPESPAKRSRSETRSGTGVPSSSINRCRPWLCSKSTRRCSAHG